MTTAIIKNETKVIAKAKLYAHETYAVKEGLDTSFSEKVLKQVERIDLTAFIATDINELMKFEQTNN